MQQSLEHRLISKFFHRCRFYSTRHPLSLPAQAHTSLLLCHLRILFLETLAETLGALEKLVHASHNATLLFALEALGAEVVHAIIEASLDQVGVHLCRAALARSDGEKRLVDPHTFMKSFICFLSIRL
jgi:hypothetical protein